MSIQVYLITVNKQILVLSRDLLCANTTLQLIFEPKNRGKDDFFSILAALQGSLYADFIMVYQKLDLKKKKNCNHSEAFLS